MPCWEVRTTTVKLEAANLDILERAILAEFGGGPERLPERGIRFLTGDGVAVTIRGGKMTTFGAGRGDTAAIAARLVPAYARACVQAAAERMRWTVTTDAKAPARLTLRRRG